MNATKENHGLDQARVQLSSVKEMAATMEGANLSQNEDLMESARQTIFDDALSVQVRSDWVDLNQVDQMTPQSFCILLCTGGPAVRIIGKLDANGEPERARLEYQDWGTPWTALPLSSEDEAALIAYASVFHFVAYA